MSCGNDTLSAEDVTTYVRTRLGAPVIDVELDTTQVQLAMNDALTMFQRYLPIPTVSGHILNPGQHAFAFPENMMGLLDVEFVDGVRADGLTIEAALLSNPWTFIASGVPNIDIRYYDLQRNWLETTARVFAGEDVYYLTEDTLYVRVAAERNMTLTWGKRLETPEEIPREYRTLYKDLVVAISQEMLAMIRGKYEGVPASGGGTVQLDAGYLRQRSAEERNRILEELKTLSSWYIPHLA